jgi:hypothetical protein
MSIFPPQFRKRRTREHVVADLSVNHIERQALLCGFSVERWLHDYGIDLVLSTYSDEGETESGLIVLQVKATDHLKTIRNGKFVTCRIDRSDLRAWLGDPMPVILILYDALSNRAYWLYVQAVFGGVRRFQSSRGSLQLTVRIPIDQVVDVAAIRRFREFRDRIKEQREGAIHAE